MGPISAVGTAFAKIFSFSGRASRSEFWWFFLFSFILVTGAILVDMTLIVMRVEAVGEVAVSNIGFFDLLTLWVYLALAIPTFSLCVRRLHDAGFSGFWLFLNIIPFGAIALLVMYMLPSQNNITVHGSPAADTARTPPARTQSGKPASVDAHKRAMQGYAVLFDKDKQVTPQMQAARKAEISDYYRSKVLKPATPV